MYVKQLHNNEIVRRIRLFAALSLAIVGVATSGTAAANPKIQHWTTTNGARVYFVASPELPIIDIHVVFDAGSARDGKQAGLAKLTNALLDQGAGDLNADQIAEKLDDVGANLDTSSYRDMAIVSLRSLTEPRLLDPALAIMTQVIGKPTFPEDAFKLEQKRTLIALRGQKESPSAIARNAFFAAVYGNHPYATPSLGTKETVSALTRKDVIAYHKRYYTARNAVVAIVGAVDRKTAEKITEQVMGKLAAGQAAPALPTVQPIASAKVERIDYPSAQTHILMGQPGMSRGDPDYFPLLLGNHILGGDGLISRIADEVRQKRGLAYSAYSYFTPMHVKGPFTAGLQTRNEKADTALKVLKDTLSKFIAEGPTADELTAAKKNITGSFALNLDSNSKIVDNLASIAFYKLPLDYLDTYNQHIEAVTAKQIRDAFRRRVHPQDMVTVIVGGKAAATAKQ